MTEQTTFDPSRYLTKVGRADYLEVKWRLVWLRETLPDAALNTICLNHVPGQYAEFKATISIPGHGSADGHGMEEIGDFRDYYEKAETKAIGRALAALGFGTQFCEDHAFGADQGKVVDAPVDQTRVGVPNQSTSRPLSEGRATTSGTPPAQQLATPKQLVFMKAVAREAGLDEDGLDAEVQKAYGKPAHELSRRDASSFIERLQNRRASLDLAS